MQIVWQNESWVAVAKAAQTLSVPSRDRDDPRPCLGLELQQQLGRQIFPVHRLDFEVSGLMLYALTPAAHRAASIAFEGRDVRKTYEAFCEVNRGTPADFGPNSHAGERRRWESLLVRGKKRSFVAPHGKTAITEAEFVRAESIDASPRLKLRLYPLTGRAHQLRVECARHGLPIWNDTLYGAKARPDFAGIALRATALDFGPLAGSFGLPDSLSLASYEPVSPTTFT